MDLAGRVAKQRQRLLHAKAQLRRLNQRARTGTSATLALSPPPVSSLLRSRRRRRRPSGSSRVPLSDSDDERLPRNGEAGAGSVPAAATNGVGEAVARHLEYTAASRRAARPRGSSDRMLSQLPPARGGSPVQAQGGVPARQPSAAAILPVSPPFAGPQPSFGESASAVSPIAAVQSTHETEAVPSPRAANGHADGAPVAPIATALVVQAPAATRSSEWVRRSELTCLALKASQLDEDRRATHERAAALQQQVRAAQAEVDAAQSKLGEMDALRKALQRAEADVAAAAEEAGAKQAVIHQLQHRVDTLDHDMAAAAATHRDERRRLEARLEAVTAESRTSNAALCGCRQELAESYKLVSELGDRLASEQKQAQDWRTHREVGIAWRGWGGVVCIFASTSHMCPFTGYVDSPSRRGDGARVGADGAGRGSPGGAASPGCRERTAGAAGARVGDSSGPPGNRRPRRHVAFRCYR